MTITLVCTLLRRPLHDYDVKLPLVMRRFVEDLERTRRIIVIQLAPDAVLRIQILPF